MDRITELRFEHAKNSASLLPARCAFDAMCYEEPETRTQVGSAIEEVLLALSFFGIDLRSLARDC